MELIDPADPVKIKQEDSLPPYHYYEGDPDLQILGVYEAPKSKQPKSKVDRSLDAGYKQVDAMEEDRDEVQ
jgi:hypothetical protein